MKQHNQRMKYLLQSGTKSFMEFDDIHHFMADKLGLPYTRIPTDVLDAFNHDPAAVTGPTRRLSGWRAVEDIHLRLERQRDTLLLFTSALSNTIEPMALSSNAIYDEAITTLSDRLDQLHVERSEVLQKVRRTNELVAKVKELRDKLKPEFDEAGRTTSANYPEVSRGASNYQLTLIHRPSRTAACSTGVPIGRVYEPEESAVENWRGSYLFRSYIRSTAHEDLRSTDLGRAS